MKANRARRARLAVDVLLAVAFIVLPATPIAWGRVHECVGMATFALAVVHIALSRKAVGRLARRRGVEAFATLAVDALLSACLVGLAASSIVLSEHALSWAPAVPGSWWARICHLLCSYWGFVLAFVHAGLHLRAMARRANRSKANAWAKRIAFAAAGILGVWSFADWGIWSYLTLSAQFAFVDPDEPLLWRILQCASMGVLVAGVSHCTASACRAFAQRRREKCFRIPTKTTGASSRCRGRFEKKEKGIWNEVHEPWQDEHEGVEAMPRMHGVRRPERRPSFLDHR